MQKKNYDDDDDDDTQTLSSHTDFSLHAHSSSFTFSILSLQSLLYKSSLPVIFLPVNVPFMTVLLS